jgi:hypothetical protein
MNNDPAHALLLIISLEECMTWKLIANRRWSYPKTRVSYKTQRERERERENCYIS